MTRHAVRRGLLFLNPRAGTFSTGDESSLRTLAAESGLRVLDVSPEVDVRKAVREALDAGMRSFVVAGGDGSVHHVAQALVNTDGVLGVLPVGSVNHLARDLGVPLGDWRAAFDIALSGEVRQIDVGRANGRYFINSVMVGLYPTVSEYRERFRSVNSRWAAYFKAVRLALRHFPHVTLVVEHDGKVETFRTQMFVVAVNAYDLSQVGMVAPKTTLHDGRLSIYSLSFMNRPQFVRAAAKYFRGKIGDVPGFRTIRTTQLRVDTGRRGLRVSLDGELVDIQTPLQIAAVPASLLVRAPVVS
ncbi:MAG TPA: diacylglycerol kinase family protein [Thermoanaerobaculia bacterium]|jgi:diacylglycerol kinase family enzyme|nr:diacylglycerol kinase family protein [Thermoanaerobaculia bacterium]